MGGIDLPGGGTSPASARTAQTRGVFVADIRIVAIQVETLATSP